MKRTVQFIGVGIVFAALAIETIKDLIKGENDYDSGRYINNMDSDV